MKRKAVVSVVLGLAVGGAVAQTVAPMSRAANVSAPASGVAAPVPGTSSQRLDGSVRAPVAGTPGQLGDGSVRGPGGTNANQGAMKEVFKPGPGASPDAQARNPAANSRAVQSRDANTGALKLTVPAASAPRASATPVQ
jgi:hypothetical protein